MADDLVEEVARAICAADELAPDPDAPIYLGMKAAKAWEARIPQASAAIAAWNRRAGWRPISEAPLTGDSVMLWAAEQHIIGHWLRGMEQWEDSEGNVLHPTHFMPLPAPPETTND